MIFLCWSLIAMAQLPYQIAPPSEWVAEVAFERTESYPEDTIRNGTYFLLADNQEHPKAETRESFRKYVEMVVNQNGIRTVSQVSINFDPTYQELIVHSINIHRGEQVFDKLRTANISILQREENLDAQLYDGSQTFNAILDDIQVGDILEYSYTLRGENPVFQRKYYGGFNLQWRVPVYQVRYRVLWPHNQQLHFKLHKSAIEPEVRSQLHFTEYHFALDHVPALVSDSDLPNWYDPYPWVQFSETKDWEHVIDWGNELYQIPSALSPELRQKIEEIDTTQQQPEAKLLAALRFVQDEIRYMGIETGPGSHRPHQPSQVFQRRFGDCKDKTLLTLTMLHHMGIDADPAFVNTRTSSQVKDWHPSPYAFNHVLLRASVGGKHYWLDPTRSYQRGGLDQIYQPDYGYALLLNHNNKNLVPMPSASSEQPTKEIRETFDLRPGFDQPATFEVETTYRGGWADYFRRKFAVASRQEIEKSYLNYYADKYPKIYSNSSVVTEDDPGKNEFIIKESYTIEDFWKYSEKKNRLEASFYPLEFYELFKKPSTKQRLMPLDIKHKTHSLLSTEVLLPEEWPIESDTVHIEDEAIFFHSEVRYQDERLTLTYEYKAKADHVPADQVADHLNTLDKINWELGYTIYTRNTTWQDDINWALIMLAILITGIACFAAMKVYRYDPKGFEDPQTVDSDYQIIGVWLNLVGLFVFLHPLWLLGLLYKTSDTYLLSTWRLLTTPGSEDYHFLWQPILIFELCTHLFWLVFSTLMVFLFSQRRRTFPKIYVGYLIVTLTVQVIDGILVMNMPANLLTWTPKDTVEVATYAVFAMIFGVYFTYSKRVEKTFIMNHSSSHSPSTATIFYPG